MSLIRNAEELVALYGQPLERSVKKQLDRLDDHCRAFIAVSPLVIVGTQSRSGVADNSPRGDAPGFVRVLDDRTVLIPDRRGNNRLDSLRNIVENPAVGLLFLVPGAVETFRINGDAVIQTDRELCESFAVQGKAPKTVMVVTVKEAYVQCTRALVRADVWNPAKFVQVGVLPSFGTMLEAHTRGFVDGKAVDEDNKTRVPQTLY